MTLAEAYLSEQEAEAHGGLFHPHLEAVPLPEKSSGSVSLRTYQKNAVSSVLREFKGDIANGKEPVKKTLCVMATGTGKSLCIAELVRKAQINKHPVLVMVHRKELIEQLAEKINRFGVPTLKERAEENAIAGFGEPPFGVANVVIASTATLKGDRLQQWERNSFKLIISDECHHVVSPGQMAILEHFGVMENHTRLVGFTATADRLDGKGLIKAFDSLAFEYNLEAAINDPEGPFLAKPVAYTIETDPPIDLKDLRIVAGDFNKGDLERKINDNIGTLVNALIDSGHLGDKKFICFTPDVASAHAVAAALDDVGIKAKAVSGKTEDTERQNIIDEYKTGAIQGMINCMIFTEGFDAPETEAIVILRPTKSRSLYSQMVGRGTRPKANGGECSVIDFAYMTGTHQLVSSVDLYDNKDIDDAVIDRAREIVKEKKQIDPKEAIEEAQAEFDLSERVRIERRVAKLRVKKFDLVTTYDLLGMKDKAGQQWGDTKAATPKMIKFAQNCGVDLHEGAGFGTTKKILDTLSTRRKYGLSTMKQVATCIRLSHQKEMNIRPEEFRKMKFEEASAFIGQHKTW